MLYYLLYPLAERISLLNVIRYPSFRVVMAAFTSLFVVMALMPWFIRKLAAIKLGQTIRDDGPESHQVKAGTPTMGGVLMLVAMLVATLLWADLSNVKVWLVLLVTTGFGIVGFIDDYAKFRGRNTRGLKGSVRLVLEFSIALALILVLLHYAEFDSKLGLPFVSTAKWYPDIGWLYIPLAMVAIVGTANAVNLTDGLDGLAIGPVIISATTFLVLAYAAGTVFADFNIAQYLHIAHVEGANELAVFCGAMAMAGVGFLWFNSHPAQVFMGDVGALSLGGGLGALAVLTKQEVTSVVIHGVFLAEALSVIVQVVSFKTTGRRVFKMAPLHHHFELNGWAEPKVIVRFWIVAMMLALFALATLKLR
jgi:phospho-N-acetylmuramoyl-pentapeptide-transferase